MTIEQFLWKTVVKTGREARVILGWQQVKIKSADGSEKIATEGDEVLSTDTVLWCRNRVVWIEVAHPSDNG